MAEIEFAGVSFKGGKMVVIFTALSTLCGGAWGAFEVYKDYMDMKEIIQNIDTAAIAARNDVIETKLNEAIDYTRDIKNGLKEDIIRIEKITDDTDRRVKEIQRDIDKSLKEVSDLARESEKDARDTMRTTENRIDDKMLKLETGLNKKIEEALNNPLSK
jgi:hypothetical protein